jgi:group II intron reverse transcriptase/maturase
MDMEWLQEAFRRTRKDGAVGIDGQTAEQYGARLEENLAGLLERAKSGLYRAPAVRRVYIPKADGSQRPLGVPTFEDKVLQRAVAMLLEPLYEQEFLDCSWGFRRGRSPHGALEEVRRQLMDMGGGWVLDVDLRKFFDTLKHDVLRQILARRVRDGVVTRLIGKWLNAGVLEEGAINPVEDGTPQGGVISPLLANIYLHEAVDEWFQNEIKPRLSGAAFMIRYADDLVLGFASEQDARRVLAVLPKRLGKYGLSLHPEKTRLLDFRRPGGPPQGGGPGGERGSFDFLGFTHYWAESRGGKWVIKRKTSKSRLSRALQAIDHWCAQHRHQPVAQQQEKLNQKLRGHCAYYGITGNARALSGFREESLKRWRKWLGRRSQKGFMNWAKFKQLLERHPILPPLAIHSIYRRAVNP